jgi:hypothetical protein
MGPSYIGDLVHWHFDTFKVNWRDRALGSTYVTFALDARGKVKSLTLQRLGDFERSAPEHKMAAGSP